MTALPEVDSSRELDPLSLAAIGTALSGLASFVWPELVAGAVTLAALASFVAWIRVLRALRRPGGKPRLRGWLPPAVLGGAGWSAALWMGGTLPRGAALLLGAVVAGLWLLTRSSGIGG